MLNHGNDPSTELSFFHKALHLDQNLLYLHPTNFNDFTQDETISRREINVSELYSGEPGVDPTLISGTEP